MKLFVLSTLLALAASRSSEKEVRSFEDIINLFCFFLIIQDFGLGFSEDLKVTLACLSNSALGPRLADALKACKCGGRGGKGAGRAEMQCPSVGDIKEYLGKELKGM